MPQSDFFGELSFKHIHRLPVSEAVPVPSLPYDIHINVRIYGAMVVGDIHLFVSGVYGYVVIARFPCAGSYISYALSHLLYRRAVRFLLLVFKNLRHEEHGFLALLLDADPVEALQHDRIIIGVCGSRERKHDCNNEDKPLHLFMSPRMIVELIEASIVLLLEFESVFISTLSCPTLIFISPATPFFISPMFGLRSRNVVLL